MSQHSNHKCPRRRRQKKAYEKIFEEIIVKNFPIMGKEIATHIHETQGVPNRINPRWNTYQSNLQKLNTKRKC